MHYKLSLVPSYVALSQNFNAADTTLIGNVFTRNCLPIFHFSIHLGHSKFIKHISQRWRCSCWWSWWHDQVIIFAWAWRLAEFGFKISTQWNLCKFMVQFLYIGEMKKWIVVSIGGSIIMWHYDRLILEVFSLPSIHSKSCLIYMIATWWNNTREHHLEN